GFSGGGGMSSNVDPGTYQVSLYKRVGGDLTELAGPVSLEVERIRKSVLTNPAADKHKEYNLALAEFTGAVSVYQHKFKKATARVSTYERSLKNLKSDRAELTKAVYALRSEMHSLQKEFGGSAAKAEVGEKDMLTLMDRLSNARGGYFGTSYGPTALHMASFDMAKEMFNRAKPKMNSFISRVNSLGKALEEAGAPVFLD
ncbi:MAG: glycosyl hydrolase, partial [Bacteroidetes bacterium]|nr:glycosyl hydrolase [Bacteroidota bacterium]